MPSLTSASMGCMCGVQGYLWLHGGYRTPFPYPTISSPGAGPGTSRMSGQPDLAPYPTLPYFLDDLWQYNISTLLITLCGGVLSGAVICGVC